MDRVKHQSRVDDIQCSEKVRIYHHELHRKQIQRSSILKLTTQKGVLEGHTACSDFLQKSVEDLLLNPAQLYQASQETLLAELEEQRRKLKSQSIYPMLMQPQEVMVSPS